MTTSRQTLGRKIKRARKKLAHLRLEVATISGRIGALEEQLDPGSCCCDCELSYEQFPGDLLVSDVLWKELGLQIEGDLLCPACLCERLRGRSKIQLGFNGCKP